MMWLMQEKGKCAWQKQGRDEHRQYVNSAVAYACTVRIAMHATPAFRQQQQLLQPPEKMQQRELQLLRQMQQQLQLRQMQLPMNSCLLESGCQLHGLLV
jgi:hypothetical protein